MKSQSGAEAFRLPPNKVLKSPTSRRRLLAANAPHSTTLTPTNTPPTL